MDENTENLSRRERRDLEREQEKDQKKGGLKNPKFLGIGLAAVIGIIAIGYFLFRDTTKPTPGEIVPDAGQEHVTDIDGISYTSNPPSSGSHFAIWAKPGVYDRFISDGYFIHSMEHGYVILWYDCSKLAANAFQLIPSVLAHDEPAPESTNSGKFLMHMNYVPQGTDSWFSPQNPPEIEVSLPDSFTTDSCKSLASQLSEFTKVAQRVIVVPRQNLDTVIALTAWGRLDKLDSVNKDRIEAFIKAFHNRGPEKTME